MYVVGTVFPPLLPTVFVVSVGISAKRLQKQRITCTNPEAILAAGRVNVAFFDKTGTLTKQGFDFASSESAIDDGSNDDQIALGMAVCHTLTTTQDGNLVGNHVDLVAFESTGSTLVLGDTICVVHNGKKYTVLKRYEFDNHRRTQSVIIQDDNGLKSVFVKGSPEAIVALCDKETVPTTVAARARKSAKSGLYQLAIASKSFDFDGSIADVRRDDVEKSLKFEGFLNFENTLRDETSAVLKELEQGDVISTMVTGDNVFTGIHIAREAGLIKSQKRVIVGKKGEESEEIEWTDADSDEMVDKPEIGDEEVHLALTGEAWAILLRNDPKYANSIARQVRVFGRCNPSDKVSVVTNFVENGSITLMCGDGENDCGALKAAHAGVAMSSSEASVVAPFTSLDKTITSVINVLREGRCALASAFACYKYMIMYGQIETINQVINAYLAITFTEWCWFFMDGIWVLTVSFVIQS
jgi:cation-transporting ATPase 13A3/4/5